jgi:hypothetical protein
MTEKPDPVCDVCGKPATNCAVDTVATANHVTGYMEVAPIGRDKLGCDEHPTTSEHYESDPTILHAFRSE